MVSRLAGSIASRWRAERDELVQTGMVVVCRLASRFDEALGATFGTFVFEQVRSAMLVACRTDHRDRARARLLQRGAAALLRSTLPQTFDEVLATDDAASAELLEERIAALAESAVFSGLSSKTPEDLVADAQEAAKLRGELADALAKLDPVDRELVQRCSIEQRALADAARAVGLPYDQARYRYTKALARMGQSLRGRSQ